MFKKLVIDRLLQKWYNDMNMCNYLPMFKHFKINFGSLNVSWYFAIEIFWLNYVYHLIIYELNRTEIIEIEHQENSDIVFYVMLTIGRWI